jgi:hypothetical protein
MSMNRTHTSSIAASGRKGRARTCADLFSAAEGSAAVVCPEALPTYLPGGEVRSEGAKSMINLWNSDRRVSLI